ncbi:MFS general substrate transporter, partial [Hortaea werneckii]
QAQDGEEEAGGEQHLGAVGMPEEQQLLRQLQYLLHVHDRELAGFGRNTCSRALARRNGDPVSSYPSGSAHGTRVGSGYDKDKTMTHTAAVSLDKAAHHEPARDSRKTQLTDFVNPPPSSPSPYPLHACRRSLSSRQHVCQVTRLVSNSAHEHLAHLPTCPPASMPPSRAHSRPSSHRSANGDGNGSPQIGKLEYQPGGRPLLTPDTPRASHQSSPRASSEQSRSYAGSFFSDVAEGIATQQRSKINRQVLRYLSFAWAIINCLGAGSITAYSLYAPLFQRRLHYTQLQVNGVSITAELAMYLPVPLFGFLCDRFGPGVPSLLAGVLFGLGYVLAAFTYASGPPPSAGGDGRPYWSMILAFIPIGCGTSCMYLSAVTTCAKNFGRGKYKGLALALPIACFGLSGMWESQVGSQLLYERLPGGGKGEVDVYRFFLFLGCFLLAAGAMGFFALRIVGEEELIDEAVEELEASGLLEDSAFFQPSNRDVTSRHTRVDQLAYGTLPTGDRRLSAEEVDELHQKAAEHRAYLAEQDRKKAWLLNEETRRFLTDKTMWWLAAGFFLVTGPGEAFINNLGTIIGTLYPPPTS